MVSEITKITYKDRTGLSFCFISLNPRWNDIDNAVGEMSDNHRQFKT